MLKWIVVLVIGAGAFYVVQNWSTLSARVSAGIAQLDLGLVRKETPRPEASRAASSHTGAQSVESWAGREISGLRVTLPFPVEPYTAKAANLPPYIHIENYKGEVAGRKVAILHGTNSGLAGGLMLGWFDKPLGSAAELLQMDVISKNSATTLLNGFRARRSDYVTRTAPRVRARCVLLERGNQAWFIEYHAPETDSQAEQAFQRIANSAHTL
jgi:hypothetical protein